MKKSNYLVLFILSILSINTYAANFLVTAKMKNGDIISGKSTLTKLSIKTDYGDLNIPADKITNINFGTITDKTKDAIVRTELKKLQMANPKEAEIIHKNLLQMGVPILGIVKSYTESSNYQVSDNYDYSVEDLLEKLYNQADLEYGATINDVLEFDLDSRVEGNIQLNEILINSNYGNLTLKRENITSLELTVIDDNVAIGDNVFKLNANKHITGNDEAGWLKTGVKVKIGSNITINGNGKIVLKSLSGGIYGPDGFVGGKTDSAYDAEAEIPYGSLVYKIGIDGDTMKAGSKKTIQSETEGELFISIYETVFNKENTGSYTVKIIVK